MLKSTANLLVRIHSFFEEVGYNPTSNSLNSDELIEKVIYTINHSKELEDALFVTREFVFYFSKENKFLKKLSKYAEAWDSLEYNGREEVAVVDDDEAIGIYYVTNAFSDNYTDVFISGQSFDGKLYCLENKDGCFSFGEDSEYYLRFGKMSSNKMVLMGKNKENMATIVLHNDCNISLENNKTQLEAEPYGGGMAFYDKDYFHSLSGKEADLEKCKAFIEWDIVDEDGNFGLSRLVIFDTEVDLCLLLMIAASCFLTFGRKMKRLSSSHVLIPSLIMMNRSLLIKH